MNDHDELLTKVLTRLKNNYFTNIKSVLSDTDKPGEMNLAGINDSFIPDITAEKAGKNYIVEVETSETFKEPVKDTLLKAISKFADENNYELVIAVPAAMFMEVGKKLSQLKVDASIWDI